MHFHYPPHLPVSEHKNRIIEALEHNQVLIVAGETGSGKTTQLPKMCLEFLQPTKKMVGCTQPRRIAALTVAARVAEELKEFGSSVGHKIRFQDRTNDETRIKFMTDGVLLAETRSDKMLKKYEVLIIDEAHERSLNIDFLLGYLQNILPSRKDLKIIITSATIDTEAFSQHFSKAPIITVGGKTFPIETRYLPAVEDEYSEKENYIDHCIRTVYDLYMNEPPGDMLVFLPTEKDIRQCSDLLKKKIDDAEILPLFGRLHSSDQKKIFSQYHRTKIVIATNVAETSITVPGIRYIIDTGLARMSYYNFRAKTNSLPIKKISRASCDQRKGRCGRIGPGICLRLYSEQDYLDREEFTVPEIQRSNLAEVVLQMLHFKLGDPHNFPFINPPHGSAIREGFQMLRELGGIDSRNNLTQIGRSMASMPIDPCVARIVIEAKSNACLREIKIIASALAIQDPRVRPTELEKKADAAHQAFAQPHSDFMSLLQIWDLFHQTKTSWSRLKKFCKSHFLSFQRMREWIDLHEQMTNILKGKKNYLENTQNASYEAIHKSLAIGFLRNIGVKKQGKLYQATSGKEVMIFPGSHQFSKSPQWIIAASFLETNRLYALTVASIDPVWLESIGKNLCKYSWTQPKYHNKSGQVVAQEKVTLHGLVIVPSRTVNFGTTNEQNQIEARLIFIQSALIEGQLSGSYNFLLKNLQLIEKWQGVEDKLRSRNIVVHDEILHQFYEEKLPKDIYDRPTLNKYLKQPGMNNFLLLQESDVLQRKPIGKELADFPPEIRIGTNSFRLSYLFDPLHHRDGVTVKIPIELTETLNEASFEWLVPGLLREKLEFLLKGLPKRIRKHLIPINLAVDKILDDIDIYRGSFYRSLQNSIHKQFGINIQRSDWPDQLPHHLRMNFWLYDGAGKMVAEGQHLTKIFPKKTKQTVITSKDAREKERKEISKWEKTLIKTWDFDNLPDKLPLFTPANEIAAYLYPAVTPVIDKGAVTISFHTSELEAREQNKKGVQFLYRLHFPQQFKALKKFCHTCISGPSTLWLTKALKSRSQVTDTLIRFILQTIFTTEGGVIPDRKTFQKNLRATTQSTFYTKGVAICNTVTALLRKRNQVAEIIVRYEQLAKKSHSHSPERYEDFKSLLIEILPEDFLLTKTYNEFEDCGRYIRSLNVRIERCHANFHKDQEKAIILLPYTDDLSKFEQKKINQLSPEGVREVLEFKQMIQEMRVSLFSPEIKTKFPVSKKKLSQAWQRLRNECG